MSKSLNLFIILLPPPKKTPKALSKFSQQEHSVDRISLKGLEINRVTKSSPPPSNPICNGFTICFYYYILQRMFMLHRTWWSVCYPGWLIYEHYIPPNLPSRAKTRLSRSLMNTMTSQDFEDLEMKSKALYHIISKLFFYYLSGLPLSWGVLKNVNIKLSMLRVSFLMTRKVPISHVQCCRQYIGKF